MLVVSRKKSEAIVIRVPGHHPIKVVLADIRGPKVRFGVMAAQNVEVNRLEVDQAKHPGDYPAEVA